MKTTNILLVGALAAALAGCWESGAGNTQLNDMMIEPPVNLVGDLPAEENAATPANTVEAVPATAPPPAPAPAQAKAAPTTEPRAPATAPAPAPTQEPADPHAGHDMSNMNHQ